MLAKQPEPSKYCFGDQVTAADIVFYPQMFATKNRWKVDTSQHKNIERVFRNLSEVKDFVETAPSKQPDCPI